MERWKPGGSIEGWGEESPQDLESEFLIQVLVLLFRDVLLGALEY